MHREFDHTKSPFDRPSNTGTYLATFVLLALVVADGWPPVAGWLDANGLAVPTWTSRTVLGVRFALIAAILGTTRSLLAAVERLPEGKVGADLAVAVAGLAAIFIGEPLVAAEVVLVGMVGECLEAITFDRTQRAVRGLAELFPLRTWVLRDGVEVRALTNDLLPGDVVVVKPGGKIPVDGVILGGTTALDTAALTGESVPREVGPGDAVLAGMVNTVGSIQIRADKVKDATVAGRVIELTAQALKQKAPLERTADRLARYFLPVVLAVAAVTFGVHLVAKMGPTPDGGRVSFASAARSATYPALGVLVVACPCPLVLATPAAVVAALGRLAGTGVLVKGGAALERLAAVTTMAFDKTGTLTEGKPQVGTVRAVVGTNEELLRLAAAVEKGSEHPLGRAIAAAADVPAATDFRAHPGGGVSGTVEGRTVLVGSPRFLTSQGVAVPDIDTPGETSVVVAADGVVLGYLGLRDTLRPEAAGVLDELQKLGLTTLVLTGDRAAAATAVAGQLPNTAIHAELLPTAKADAISARPPGSTAFVGDGVNDAPALATAAVGLAVGGGADIAAEAGDIVLMGDPLRQLPLLVRLSRATVAVIRQNVIWFGFGVNAVGVLLAGYIWPFLAPSAGWYEASPLVGVLYHQIGSLAVLLNSMRLLAFDRGGRWTAVRQGFAKVEDTFSAATLDDTFHELTHYWKPIAVSLAAIAVVGWLLSGLTQIDAPEVGVVRRFGAVRNDLRPGLHVRFPWPIEEVVRVNPTLVRTVPVGFRFVNAEQTEALRAAAKVQQTLKKPTGQTWASTHADEISLVTDEAVLVTGDGNLVEVLATVRYTASDPRLFLFRNVDPEAFVRSSAEAALRELAAGRAFAELLTTDRPRFEADATAKLNQRLAAAGDMGVSLAGLTVHDLHPPPEVVAAYHEVAAAVQKRDRLVNEAAADATRAKRRAQEEALRLVRSSEAAAAAKIAEATASRDVFLAWHAARSQLPSEDAAAFAAEVEKRVMNGEDRAAVTTDVEKRKGDRLAARRFVSDLRLTLDATVRVLAGRDKVFVDADRVPGRRQLLFADPEAGKLPAWLLRPPAGEKEQ